MAERILDRWNHDPLSVRFFRSSANFLHVFRYEGERYFLRFADSAERTRADIEAEMNLVGRLDRMGVAVAAPVPSRRGNVVETVETDRGDFHAAVFPALRGSQWDIDDLDVPGFHRWGTALGALHGALRQCEGEFRSGRASWEDQLDAVTASLETRKAIVREEDAAIRLLLRSLPADREVFGLIHADFELDNLVWSDRAVGILDFDDCVHSWYVADIALALRDLFPESVDLENPSFQAFIRSYAEYHPVDRDILRHIPTFLRFGRLLAYGRLVRSLDLPPDAAYPEWLTTLQRKLETWVIAYENGLERRRADQKSDA